MKRLQIIVPYYPLGQADVLHAELIQTFVQALVDSSTSADITICHDSDSLPDFQESIRLVRAPLDASSEELLPAGWLEALQSTPVDGDAIVFDYRCDGNVRALIDSAVQALHESGRGIALGVINPEDHPCQLLCPCEVLSSLFCIPREGNSLALDQFLLNADCPSPTFSSEVFAVSWDMWLDRGADIGVLYEVVVEAGQLRRVDAPDRVIGSEQTFFFRESRDTARLLSFSERNARCDALPITGWDYRDGVSIESEGDKWRVNSPGTYIQLFSLTEQPLKGRPDDSVVLHRLTPDVQAGSVLTPKVRGPFILNIYDEAVLPYVDIEIPYVPHVPAWRTSTINHDRYNNGNIIHGRQAFPEVHAFQGSVMSLSSAARRDPVSALRELDLTVFSVDCDVSHATPAVSPSSPCEGAARVTIRHDDSIGDTFPPILCWATRTLQKRRVSGAIETAAPILTRYKTEKSPYVSMPSNVLKQRFEERFGSDNEQQTCSSGGTFEAAWRETLEKCDLTGAHFADALRIITDRYAELSSNPYWLLEVVDEALANYDIERAMTAAQLLYTLAPGAGNLFTGAASNCMSQHRYEDSLLLMDIDKGCGWLSEANEMPYIQSLSLCGEVERAETVVEENYKMNMHMRNGYSEIGWNAYFVINYEPEKALQYFIKDEDLGRFSDARHPQKAILLATLGRFDEALAIIQHLYDKNAHIGGIGFARVGWEYYANVKHTPEKSLPYFQKSRNYGHESFLRLELALKAYMGELEASEAEVDKMHSESTAYPGMYLYLGILHWLKYRDDAVLHRLVFKEHKVGGLNYFHQVFSSLICRAKGWGASESVSGFDKTIGGGGSLGERRCLRWLQNNAYRTADIEELLGDVVSREFLHGAIASKTC